MAYVEARAGLARSGVVYAGFAQPRATFKVGGVTRRPLFDEFSIDDALDSTPGRMRFGADSREYVPEVGQSVEFLWTTPNASWFAGTITSRAFTLDRDGAGIWRCDAIDNTWLLSRYKRVRADYYAMGFNSILARLVADFTDGGFGVGHCPSSLGDVGSISFDGETVPEAIDRLAEAAGAFWFVDADRNVHLFDDLPDGNALAIVNSSAIRVATYDQQLVGIRNETTVLGASSQATAVVYPGATTIPVDDTRGFADGSGQARVGSNVVSYTGKSPASGPGSLTGCSGINTEIAQGDAVRVQATASDAVAQAALAALLGGGLSGVAVNTIQDDQATDAEARAIATADVANFSAPLQGFTFDTTGRYVQERFATIGKTITVNLTSPLTVSGTMRIEGVSIKVRRYVPGAVPEFTRRVTARVGPRFIARFWRNV